MRREMAGDPLSTIARRDVEEAEFMRAIESLGAVTESPRFWTDLANSPDFGKIRRGHCVMQLFRRHVPPGTKLSGLGRVLDRPDWLRDEDVDVVADLGGKVPVRWTLEDTVFVLRVVPELPGKSEAVYLRVSGKVDRGAFLKALRGQEVDPGTADATVLEIGISGPG
jgi:hypothetical protein